MTKNLDMELSTSPYFASRGLVAFSAKYRIFNTHGTTPFDALWDAKSAIHFLREHSNELNIDPDQIVAGGGSAGGHLAAAAGNIVGLEEANENLRVSSVPNAWYF